MTTTALSGSAIRVQETGCRCGHPREAHQHFRRGSDCALCRGGGCASYAPLGGPRAAARELLDRLGRRWRPER